MKENKYKYLWVLKGNYGQGYEDLTAEETRTGIKQRLKEYRENEPTTALKVVYRRELNTQGAKK